MEIEHGNGATLQALKTALEFLGKWKPGQYQCMYDKQCSDYFHTGYREIPCPELTDALAFWMLRELERRDISPCLVAIRDLSGKQTGWRCHIFNDLSKDATDPAEAIVQAVAALAAAK